MTPRLVVRALVLAVAALFVLANACYTSISGLASFPCAEDGTCPSGFECTAGKECRPPIDCSESEETDCGGTCVTISTDAMNCGGCGNVCTGGQSCCDGQCTDTQSSNDNCGTCGTVCSELPSDDGPSCIMGKCGCPSSQTLCTDTGTCTDTTTDSNNCGECGKVCATNSACSGGKCACTSGLTSCPGGCVDLTTTSNCGECSHACEANETCTGGSCTCGPPNTMCPGGTCADTSSDPMNCGGCGADCAMGDTCSAGVCTCDPPSTTCPSGDCVDTTSDPMNCGGCGAVCDGKCASSTCCEIPMTAGPSACNPSPLCGCPAGFTCEWTTIGDVWVCEEPGPTEEGAACTQTSDCGLGLTCVTPMGQPSATCFPVCDCPVPPGEAAPTNCVDAMTGCSDCEQLNISGVTYADGYACLSGAVPQ